MLGEGRDLLVLKSPLKHYFMFHSLSMQSQTIRASIEGSEQSFVSIDGVDSFGGESEISKLIRMKLFARRLKSLTIFGIRN